MSPMSPKPHVPTSNPEGMYVFCTTYGRKWPMMGASDPLFMGASDPHALAICILFLNQVKNITN